MKNILLLSIISLMLASCATSQLGNNYSDTNIQIPNGKSILYIYRQTNDYGWGSLVYPIVYLNNTKVVDLMSGSYTEIIINPGSYNLTSKKDFLWFGFNLAAKFDIQPNQKYYIAYDTQFEK